MNDELEQALREFDAYTDEAVAHMNKWDRDYRWRKHDVGQIYGFSQGSGEVELYFGNQEGVTVACDPADFTPQGLIDIAMDAVARKEHLAAWLLVGSKHAKP